MLAGFYGLVLAMILVMRFAPQSSLGRALLVQLVERPLAWASGMRSHQLILFAMLGVVLLAGGEGFALFGSELFMAYLIDLSIYLDAVVVTYALMATSKMKGSWQALKGRLSAATLQMRGGQRHRRAPKRTTERRGKPADNDDESTGAWALAA